MKKVLSLLFVSFCFVACEDDTSKDENSVFYKEPALKSVTEEIEKNPEKASLYFERGVILDRLELDTLALKDYKKAISLDSTKAEYYSAIGDMLFEHKDLEGSVQWLSKALEINPDDKRAHLKAAKMFLYTEDYNRAFEEINVVLRQDVYNPEGYYLKGLIYKDLEDVDRAISSFQTALQVAPDFREAMMQLGIMYGLKGDPVALKYYENAYKLDSTDAAPLNGKGVYYKDKGDFELAKNAFIDAIKVDRYFLSAYYNLGYVYMQQDSIQKSLRQYEIVTKLDPASAEAYYSRGLCYELLGDMDNAIADYEQALKFDKDYSEPKERLAEIKKGG